MPRLGVVARFIAPAAASKEMLPPRRRSAIHRAGGWGGGIPRLGIPARFSARLRRGSCKVGSRIAAAKETTMTDTRPILALTIGDPAGVGPEITAKGLAERDIFGLLRPLVIGDA